MLLADVKTRLALNNILFTTDFSKASQNALPYALAFARHYQSTIFFTNVIEEIPVPTVPMDVVPADAIRDREDAEKRMKEFLKLNSLAGIKTQTLIEPGFLWPVLSRVMEQRKIDMVILGTHGRSALQRLILGSESEAIFRHATCPVMTIGPHVPPIAGQDVKIEKILFATDFSVGSSSALPFAAALADERNARLILLHVVVPPGMPINVTDHMVSLSEVKLRGMLSAEQLPQKRPEYVTVVGLPADQILAVAERDNVDLIVMGVHKGGALSTHWPFEVAAKVMAGAKCPVLSVRPETAKEVDA